MKIMKILEFHIEIHEKNENYLIPCENHKNYENHRIPCENHKNHENLRIPRENHENHFKNIEFHKRFTKII